MQKSAKWRSDWLDGAMVGSFLGTPSQKKSEANVKDSDCSVGMLFFISMKLGGLTIS